MSLPQILAPAAIASVCLPFRCGSSIAAWMGIWRSGMLSFHNSNYPGTGTHGNEHRYSSRSWRRILVMPTKAPSPSTYQLKITLLGIQPPIWQRIQVPSNLLMCCLHDAFQTVMGWTDSHLHQFEKDGKYWGDPETMNLATSN